MSGNDLYNVKKNSKLFKILRKKKLQFSKSNNSIRSNSGKSHKNWPVFFLTFFIGFWVLDELGSTVL